MSAFNSYKLPERQLPTYDDLEEAYNGKYNPSFEFDHKNPSRGKYRTRDGIRVYESGYVEVASCVHRDPDMRNKLFGKYGLVFALPKDCTNRRERQTRTGGTGGFTGFAQVEDNVGQASSLFLNRRLLRRT